MALIVADEVQETVKGRWTENFEIPIGYKITDLGVLPKEWQVKPLQNCLIGTPIYGINAPAVPYQNTLPKYIRITDITEDGQFSTEKLSSVNANSNEIEKYLLANGDLVFARTGASVGKSYLYNSKDGRLVFAGFLIKIRPDQKSLLPNFLALYAKTQYYKNWVQLTSMRSGQPGINGNEYGQLLISLPPLQEQKTIATVFSNIDSLINSLGQLIAKKRNIKFATMQQLLTGKQRLPGFRGKWQLKKLEELCQLNKGSQINKSLLEAAGEFPVWNGGMSPSGYTNKWNTKENTITISEGGNSCGFVNFSSQKFWCGGHCYSVCQIKKNIDHLFLFQKFKEMQEVIMGLRVGSGLPNIQKRNLLGLEITLPKDYEEQTAIAEILSDMDTELSVLEQQLAKARNLKQGMMQALLTGRIRLK